MRAHLIYLIVLIGCVGSFPAQAQATEEAEEEVSIRKGKVLLGSYFNLSLSTVDKTRANRGTTTSDVLDAGINVTTGKMLSDHWGVIVIGGYEQRSAVTPVNIGTTSVTFEEFSESYSLAGGVRYYALVSDATYFFIQGGLAFSRGTTSSDEFDGTSKVTVKLKTHGFTVGISPGISYFMTSKLSTEISIGLLGYTIIKGEDENGNSTEVRSFQSLLYLNSVSLGFVYYL